MGHWARLSAIGTFARSTRATSQPFRRAAGVFATSTRATGARLKLCQAQAVGRFPAESYSLPIPSFPLQPLRPHNARTRARGRDPIGTTQIVSEILPYPPLLPLLPLVPPAAFFARVPWFDRRSVELAD